LLTAQNKVVIWGEGTITPTLFGAGEVVSKANTLEESDAALKEGGWEKTMGGERIPTGG